MGWQQRLRWLGNKLDWVVGILVVGVILSAGLAEFPMQARWQSWAGFCYLMGLYSLSTWLCSASRRAWLLRVQGYLSLVFIIVSLVLWTSQTLLPELQHLQALKPYGINLPFDFSRIGLRNWAPIGHQNYVAGYLVLNLPLLVGLALLQTGWQRWMWLAGVGLGVIDLYTTSSRGGWLAGLVLAIAGFAVLLWRSALPKRWLGLVGAAGLATAIALTLANNRLQTLLLGIVNGQVNGQANSELAYRLITMTTGWHMGWSHPLTGIGPGNVPLLYQNYRPAWAGWEAELVYQLHSTPAQLWAELGLWAVVTGVGAIALLLYLGIRWFHAIESQSSMPRLLIGSLYAGLLGYGVVCLTDYQLDNVAISGTLILFLAVLASEFREWELRRSIGQMGHETHKSDQFSIISSFSSSRPAVVFLSLGGLGILIAAVIWLVSVQRAWLLSNQGFAALNQNQVNTFVQRLSQSYDLAPWEPYYADQLGWNLGNLSLQTRDAKQQQQLNQDGVSWLQRGVQASPYQEFGHSNLAWLLLSNNPKAAAQEFARSAQLVPAKRGIFYGLGLSLLADGKTNLAIAALTLEALRDPIIMTSPVWQLPTLKPLYAAVLNRVEADYTALLATAPASLKPLLHQSRGGLRWWQGDLTAAHADLDEFGSPISQLVLNLANGNAIAAQVAQMLPQAGRLTPNSTGLLAIAAWLNPTKRQEFLQQAWIASMLTQDPSLTSQILPPPEFVQQLVANMSRSKSFDQWLKQSLLVQPYRRERLGFGVLSRHTDGPNPVDFLTVIRTIPMSQFFDQLIPTSGYLPDLDNALQKQRQALLQTVLSP
jgi:hypothetical protein